MKYQAIFKIIKINIIRYKITLEFYNKIYYKIQNPVLLVLFK